MSWKLQTLVWRSRVKAEHIKEEAENPSEHDATKHLLCRIKCPLLILRAPEGMTTPYKYLSKHEEALVKMPREIPDAQICGYFSVLNHYSLVMQPDNVRDATRFRSFWTRQHGAIKLHQPRKGDFL